MVLNETRTTLILCQQLRKNTAGNR